MLCRRLDRCFTRRRKESFATAATFWSLDWYSRFHFDGALEWVCFCCQEMQKCIILHCMTSHPITNWHWLSLIDGFWMAVWILLMSKIKHKLGCLKHGCQLNKFFQQFITMSWGSTYVLQQRSLHCVVSGDVVDPWWNQYMSCRVARPRICDDISMYRIMSSLLNN